LYNSEALPNRVMEKIRERQNENLYIYECAGEKCGGEKEMP